MKARLPLLFGAGILFGLGLAISGMTDPGRVVGFLDVMGNWDPSLTFVMTGAVGIFGLGMLIWRKRAGGKGWFGSVLPRRDTSRIDLPLVGGALLFGVGWGISGFCPGPAIANLGALRLEALVFVPAMATGMIIARVFFAADQD